MPSFAVSLTLDGTDSAESVLRWRSKYGPNAACSRPIRATAASNLKVGRVFAHDAIDAESQEREALIACNALNRIAELGMSVSTSVA